MNGEASIVQYLLGELSEEARVQFEERYFSDDRVFEELLAVETELIDSFVKGELPEPRHKRFQSFYLNSPERRERVEMAKCLMQCIAEEQAVSESFARVNAKPESMWRSLCDWFAAGPAAMRIVYAAATVAVLVFGSVMLIENRHLRSDLNRMQAEKASLGKHNQDLQQQVANFNAAGARQNSIDSATETAQGHPPELFSISIRLVPGLSRNAKESVDNRLTVPSTARWVVLNLSLESNEYPGGYGAVIETAEGNKIIKLDRLASHATKNGEKSVAVRVPAKLLNNDTYVVTLDGRTVSGAREDIASYSFQIVRR